MTRLALFAVVTALAAPARAQPALPDRPIPRAEVVAAVKARFAQLDTNRDGVVSIAEYDAYRAKKEAGTLPPDTGAAAFVKVGRSWFDRSDADGNGRVTLAEATARPLELFGMADMNGDGVVSVSERNVAMMFLGK